MDDDLSDLLDDALSDFDKNPSEVGSSEVVDGDKEKTKLVPKETEEEQKKKNESSKAPEGATSSLQPPTDVFNQFFDEDMTRQLQEGWQSAMKELMEDDPELAKQLGSIPTMLDPAEGPSQFTAAEPRRGTKPTDLKEAMAATISGVKQSADEVQNMSSPSEEDKLLRDMKNMGLGGMGDMMGQLGDIEGLESNFVSMMEGMMKNLLSKDVLYPTMKQISRVYPDWLEANQQKVTAEDYKRFEKQSEVMVKICENFESEKETDSDEVKREKLNSLMNLVEEMQGYGNPPSELLEGCGPPVDMEKIFGGGGGLNDNILNPVDMNPENCAVM